MTTCSLIRILLFLTIGWMFILSPGLITYWSILWNASAYRRAEFLVTGSNYIDGGSGGRGRVSSRHYFLTGKVLLGGKSFDEEFSVGSTLPPDRPVGSRFSVFYSPTMPAFGMNYFNQRVLSAEYDSDPDILARRWLWVAARMILLSLGTAVVVHVLLRISIRRFSRPPQQLAVDLGGGHATIGTVLFSLGLFFILSQIPSAAWGGIVLGSILAGAGAPFLIRRVLILSRDDGRSARGYHFLGLAFKQQSQPLPGITRVALERGGKRFGIVMTGPAGSELLKPEGAFAANLKVATRLADFFGVTLENAVPAKGDRFGWLARRRLVWSFVHRRMVFPLVVLIALLAGGVLIIDHVPGVRLSLATTVLEPFGRTRQMDFLRRWALDRLVNDSLPPALLELLRLLNTVDAVRFPEIAADVDAAAAQRAGLTPSPEQDREARIRAINQWASTHLRKALDTNGGVLGWMRVDDRFIQSINAIAGQDLNVAWITWNHFAAGDLNSPEEFLYAVGPALGDPRPIHFAITRSGTSFDGQPLAIDSRPDVLAHTVGEALALRLWLRDGVGDNRFPENFRSWWARWAHDRRIPPPPAEPIRP